MIVWTRRIGFIAIAVVVLWWLGGCSGTSTTAPPKDDHKHGDKDDKKPDDHDKPLTEKDVEMPKSFKAGVARLEELSKKIDHLIEHGELDKVHKVAEEMALVANGMKKLAAKDLAEDKQTEAGKLCNEVAGYYKPIDEAADAGKKPETEAIHKKMDAAIDKLKKLAS